MLIFESDVKRKKFTGLWACKLEGNSSVTFRPGATAILSNATLDSDIEEKNKLKRSTLNFCRLREDKEEGDVEHYVAICSLLPGRYENFATSIPFSAGESYVFEVVGPNAVDIVGFFRDPQGLELVHETSGQVEIKAEEEIEDPSARDHDESGQASTKHRRKTGTITPNDTPPRKAQEQVPSSSHNGEKHPPSEHSPSKKRSNDRRDHEYKDHAGYEGDEPQNKRHRNSSHSQKHSNSTKTKKSGYKQAAPN